LRMLRTLRVSELSLTDTGPVDRRPNVNFTAPIGSIDLDAADEDGEPYEIRACRWCLPWYAEVRRDDDGNVFVREWHAVDCEYFQELLAAAKG
jgi:hypothetical protein